MQIEIRQATGSDEPALTEIDRDTHTPLSSIAPPPGDDHSVFGERTRPEHTLVALVDGELAGYIAMQAPHSPSLTCPRAGDLRALG